MTNAEIIYHARLCLAAKGIIGYKEPPLIFCYPDGTKEKLFEPEEIYTADGWRRKGFDLIFGEEPIATIPIWIKRGNSRGSMIRVNAKFYKETQTFKESG